MTFTTKTESTSLVTHKRLGAAALRADCIGGSIDGPTTLTISSEAGGATFGASTKAPDRSALRERLERWAPGSILPEDWTPGLEGTMEYMPVWCKFRGEGIEHEKLM